MDTFGTNNLDFNQLVSPTIVTSFPFYGTIAEANNYFDNRLDSGYWDEATDNDKRKALVMATRQIDRLNFLGDMAESSQRLQFPRGTDTTVPKDIEYATYEEAIILLSGANLESETNRLFVQSQSFSSVRTTYDRTYTQEHVRNGILSATAWKLISPYLRDPYEIQISRVD